MKPISRRRFLFRAMLAAGAPMLVSGRTLGLAGEVSPANRIAMGVVGVGCMGRGHFARLSQHPKVEILAVSDVDSWRLENALSRIAQTYQTLGRGTPSCQPYREFRDFFDRDDIDAVGIFMGDRWHAPAIRLAVRHGKDVFVEKPCALTIEECLTLSQEVHAHQRICQVDLQQRSDVSCFAKAIRMIHEGRIGKISHVYMDSSGHSREVELEEQPIPETLDWDRWLGPAPWRGFHHRLHYVGAPLNVVPWEFERDFGNGGIASGGTHNLDIINWALGMEFLPGPSRVPGEICVRGVSRPVPHFDRPLRYFQDGTNSKYKLHTFELPSGVILQLAPLVTADKADYLPPGMDRVTVGAFGALFIGSEGWINVGRGNIIQASSEELAREVRPPYTDMLRNHLENFIHCVQTREEPNCPIERGCESTFLAALGSLGGWLNRPLEWDMNTHQFLHDDEANRLCSRALRIPL